MSPSRNTPLTARSVLASVLLGTDPPWLPTPLLVRTAALFGITEGTVRTALSRMAAGGEAEAEAGGYRLSGRLVERQHRQLASRRAEVQSWDGTWELATIGTDHARPAAERAALRNALTTLRLVELREGVWGRPANLDAERMPEAASVAGRWCIRWRGATPTPPPEVGRLWDLRTWAAAATGLQREMAHLVAPLEGGDTTALAEGFVISAAVLRRLQADPLLPPELLPRSWPGTALRTDYDHYDRVYRSSLRRWFGTGAEVQ